MRKRLSLVAVLALVIAAAAASLAYAGDSSDEGESTRTIHLVAKAVEETELDLGKEGFNQGDQFVFADDLYEDGKRVGEDGGSCQLVRLASAEATFQCLVTLSLEKGQITVQGLFTAAGDDDPSPFVVAITGGTGAYRAARGEVKVETVADDDRLTVKLVH